MGAETKEQDKKIQIEDLLAQGQSVQFSTCGYSMYPFLNPDLGDQVIVVPVGEHRLRRGDVVLYRRDGERGSTDQEGFARGILVLHRIHHISGETLYLVGDNQIQIEGPLRLSQVKGVLFARVRRGRQLSTKNVLYRIFAGLWLLVCPIRQRLMRAAEIVKLFFAPKGRS